MKQSCRLFHGILIALVAMLIWAPASQAGYSYNYKIAVDHTRVAGLDGTPPSGFGFLKSITIDHTQVAGSSVTPPTNFGYVKKITIDNTKVSGASDLIDFPVMVSISNDAALKTTANGGRVTDPEGDDIVFYASDLTTQLVYEVEQYDGTAGTLVAWVRIPVLSFALDTVFYLAYGNGLISSSLANPAGVWDSNFKGVWHLKEATGATHTDSTANANNGTPVGNPTQPNQVPGKISGALDFNLSEKGTRIDIPADASLDLTLYTNWTLSAWVKPTSYTGTKWPVAYEYGNATSLGLAAQETTDGRIEHWRNDSTALWSNNAATFNAWNHIVVVSDGTNTTFYLNGSADGSGASVTLTGPGRESYIGGDTNNSLGDDDFLGLIDEVRISCGSNSSAARSAGWIATEYNNQNDPGSFMTIEDSGSLVDFPVLVSISNDATIKTTANGGRVTDPQGDDLVFYAADLTTVLDYEVEQYDGATGTLVAWVRMPALANDEDTVFYLAYGNSGVSTSQENIPGVWVANFVGVWHLKEDGDGTADEFIDSSGNSNHGQGGSGIPDNIPTQTASGKIGYAQNFDGVNDGINSGSGSSLDNLPALTFTAWIKRTADNPLHNIPRIFDKAGAGDAKRLTLDELTGYGYLKFVQQDSTGTMVYKTSTYQIVDDVWYHVAMTWDGTLNSNGINLYVDGALTGIRTSGNGTGTPKDDSVGNFIIGNSGSANRSFWGIMDEARVSNTDRSAAWIATEFNNQSNPGGFMTIRETGPLLDFPVLVSIQNDMQLKTTANGGQVTDAEGDDIIFTSDADGASPLDHEVESYDPATGTLVAWVRLPALAVSEDTIFYLHYGDSGVTEPTENPAGVWDANYKGVWHLGEDVTDEQTSGTHFDSTANANNGSQNGNVEGTGNIADGQVFDGNNDSISIGNVIGSSNAVTVSAWVKHNNLTATVERHIDMSDEVVLRHDGQNSLGQLHFYIRTDGGIYRHLRVNGVLTGDTWYHVVGTWDGLTQRVYLDGQQLSSQAPGGVLDTPGNYTISAASAPMNGTIDEVRVSDTARSVDWIETTYNNQRWPNKSQWPAEGFITVHRSVCQLAAPVACGSTTAGSIENPGAWDSFKVTLGADGWLEIYTAGTTDTYGHLYDGNCAEIAQDDTVNDNFIISQAVAAGTYTVQVRHASESGTGAYELIVECSDDDHGDSLDDATPVDCGSPTGGRIGSGADEDYFKVVFWGTGILTAFTTGSTDTRGSLLDDAGNLVAADDNSGDAPNFKIVRTVGPGLYHVVVAGSAAGDYTLQVNCEYTPVITATAEYGGSICKSGSSPCESGAVGVTYNTNQQFTITPDPGNTVRDVWVDGVWVGARTTYEFQNVVKDHKIVAVFNADFENCVDIPDIPLDSWYRSAPANIMFVLDDSGSMDWEFMTTASDGLFDNSYYYVFDNPGDNLYSRVLPDDRRMKWQSQWSGYNKLYYDPAVDYQPWPNHVAGDPALTLEQAHPDTPRSHPMIPGTTFDLNGTYYQYTSDTSAIIVDNQASGFSKTPGSAGAQNEISTGFEGADWDDGFENNGTTKWKSDTNLYSEGVKSAGATNKAGGNLTSDNLDASDLVDGDSITVDFWFRKVEIEATDFTLWYFNGNNYDFIADLDSSGGDGIWINYQHTFTDDQYFKPDFRIQLNAALDDKNEKVWVDDVVIKKNAGVANWLLVTGESEAQNGDYWWTGADGDYTATWTPNIPEDGDYDVYALWHAADDHSENVPYTINYAGGSETVWVNQRLSGDNWVKLGTRPFVAGTGGNVTLTYTRDSVSGDAGIAVADAVKFAPAGAIDVIDIKRAHYYVWSASAAKPYLVVLDGDIDYYAVNDVDGDNKIEAGEIAATVSPPADVQTGRTYAQERQNFANWYQFYRRRELSATAAVSRVIADLKGVQVGFYSINGNLVKPVVPVKSAGIDKSKNLLQALYNLKLRAQGTPLRRGLEEVGKYFADSSKMIGSSPYATMLNGGGCQQAFTIVMTDGFWNGSNPSAGNADGDDNTAFDGGGRADIYSNTLADVAMKYYETDLHTGLDDNVPTNAVDLATHQHMVTYAVSFGVTGSLNPADYDIANGSYPAWPDPRFVEKHKIDDLWHAAVNGRGEFLNASSPTELVDSLLAISRSIDSRIASSSSVSVNGDPLYQEFNDYTRIYQATYRSDSWIGDVRAYQLDDNGEVAAAPDWSAADRLATVSWDSGRIIATYNANSSEGIPFRYNRNVLSTAQQLALGSDLAANSAAERNAVKILNYLRGERTNEAQNSGAFRDRFQVLGDIVHSSPVYHNGMLYAGGNDGMLHAFDAASGDERFAYVPNLVFANLSALVDPKYSHKYFVDLSPTIRDVTLGGQAKTILVGGLGKGGKGYYALEVSNPADISNESELADRVLWEFPDPQTEGYLAYDSQVTPIAAGTDIHNSLFTAFAIVAEVPFAKDDTGILSLTDVLGSGKFLDGDELYVGFGNDVKFAEAVGGLYDPDMGYSYSRPVIAKSNDTGKAEWLVIFGNGYDSAKSHAVLYILNLADGKLIKKIDTGVGNCNGLSSPIAIDTDSNGTADYVYAGDLKGNLWKFDLQDADAANWEVAYKDPGDNPAPVFQAKNFSDHPQPITSKPDVMYHCSQPGFMVLFGTGRYLTELDLESSESASIYGIWDYGDDEDNSEYLGSFERADTPQLLNPHLDTVPARTRVKLLEQTVVPGTWTTTDGQTLRVITDNNPVWGTVADDDNGQNPDPGSLTADDTVHAGWYFDLPNSGEMVVSDVIIRDGKVLMISFTPGKDPCGSGGTSIFHAMDACSGGRPDKNLFATINAVVYKPESGAETTIIRKSSDWKEPAGIKFSGRLQPPVILRKGDLEFNYLSSSTGKIYKQETAAVKLGIYYWLQIE